MQLGNLVMLHEVVGAEYSASSSLGPCLFLNQRVGNRKSEEAQSGGKTNNVRFKKRKRRMFSVT